jgi:hypothetical protein
MSITIGSQAPDLPVNAYIPGASEPQQLSLPEHGGLDPDGLVRAGGRARRPWWRPDGGEGDDV